MNIRVMRAQSDKCQHPSVCASGMPAIHNWQGIDLCAWHSPFDSDREVFPYQDGEQITPESLLETGTAFERNMFGNARDEDYAVILGVTVHGDAGTDSWAFTEVRFTLLNNYQDHRLQQVQEWTVSSFLKSFSPMGFDFH